MENPLNILKTTELYTLKGWFLWYVNLYLNKAVITKEKKKKEKPQKPFSPQNRKYQMQAGVRCQEAPGRASPQYRTQCSRADRSAYGLALWSEWTLNHSSHASSLVITPHSSLKRPRWYANQNNNLYSNLPALRISNFVLYYLKTTAGKTPLIWLPKLTIWKVIHMPFGLGVNQNIFLNSSSGNILWVSQGIGKP